MTPKRIQRKRTKGWRMPPNTVSVTRPGKNGNPYFAGSGVGFGQLDANGRMSSEDDRDPRVQVKWFRRHMEMMKHDQPEAYAIYIAPLRGRDLACWCKIGEPCHADVLLEIANAP